jgi:hypothetical protein
VPNFKSHTLKALDNPNVAVNLPSRDRERAPLSLQNDQ